MCLAFSTSSTVFLILWEILATPDTSIFLIDEPEAHLHRGVTEKLWNEIEKIRPWSLFVYATHDLSFAARRTHAEIISGETYTSSHILASTMDWQGDITGSHKAQIAIFLKMQFCSKSPVKINPSRCALRWSECVGRESFSWKGKRVGTIFGSTAQPFQNTLLFPPVEPIMYHDIKIIRTLGCLQNLFSDLSSGQSSSLNVLYILLTQPWRGNFLNVSSVTSVRLYKYTLLSLFFCTQTQ